MLNACGSQAVWIDTVALSFYVYAAVTYIPTPGNMGWRRSLLYNFSGALRRRAFLGYAHMALFTYYMYIILGLVTVAITSFKAKGKLSKRGECAYCTKQCG